MKREEDSSYEAREIPLKNEEKRVIDIVLRDDNLELLGELVRRRFNHIFEIPVFQAMDLGFRGGKVLDLGSYCSLTSINLAKQVEDLEVCSLHSSKNVLRFSKRIAEKEAVDDRFWWVLGKPEFLPFRDSMFDLVISMFDLHHWENPVDVFREVKRVARPKKGVIVIGDLRKDVYDVLLPAINVISLFTNHRSVIDEIHHSFESSYETKDAIRMLEEAGFEKYDIIRDFICFYVRKRPEEKKHVTVEVTE